MALERWLVMNVTDSKVLETEYSEEKALVVARSRAAILGCVVQVAKVTYIVTPRREVDVEKCP